LRHSRVGGARDLRVTFPEYQNANAYGGMNDEKDNFRRMFQAMLDNVHSCLHGFVAV
jgi:hypothetical protein